jgi:hypothetical protein
VPGQTSSHESYAIRFGEERFFRPMQIALRLGYRDDDAIWRAIRSGELAAFQPSERKIIVAESEIERWLASKSVEAADPTAEAPSSAKPAQKPRRRRRTDMPLVGRTVMKK